MVRDSTSHFLDTQRIYIPTSLTKKYGVLGDFQKKTEKDIKSQEKKSRTIFKKHIKIAPSNYQIYRELALFYDKTTNWFLIPKLISDDKLVQKWGLSHVSSKNEAENLGATWMNPNEKKKIRRKYEKAQSRALKKCRVMKDTECQEISVFSSSRKILQQSSSLS